MKESEKSTYSSESSSESDPLLPPNKSTIEPSSSEKVIESVTEPKTKIFKSKREIFILIGLSLIIFSVNCGESVIAPFFTLEAKSKGVSATVVGAIFSTYPFGLFLFSPIAGKYLPVIGVRFALIAGCFVQGGSQLIFAFVDRLPDGAVYTVFCFLIRFIAACGGAVSSTSSLSILTVTFKAHLPIIFSVVELFIGLGFMSGPAIGGILYQQGGFKLPFLATGGMLLVILSCVYWLLPTEESFRDTKTDDGSDKNELASIKQTLAVPGIFVIGFTVVFVGMWLSFIDPTLSNFLLKIDPTISSEKIGFVFFLCSGSYLLLTPFVGAIVDRKIDGRVVMMVGCFGMSIGFFMLGPSPFIQQYIPRTLWLVEVSLCELGSLCALACVPIMSEMQKAGINGGLPQTLGTDSLISGIYNGSFAIGCSLGPLIGSALTSAFTFEWTATIFSMTCMGQFLLLTFFTIWEKKIYLKRKTKEYTPI